MRNSRMFQEMFSFLTWRLLKPVCDKSVRMVKSGMLEARYFIIKWSPGQNVQKIVISLLPPPPITWSPHHYFSSLTVMQTTTFSGQLLDETFVTKKLSNKATNKRGE